jgi:hypothetical protein
MQLQLKEHVQGRVEEEPEHVKSSILFCVPVSNRHFLTEERTSHFYTCD